MKQFFKIILFFFGMYFAFTTNAAPLVLDMANAPKLPNHFRMTSNVTKNESINWTGFEELHLAGGGQFSVLSLQRMRKRMQVKHFTIIDLRQESHGFLNANAVSWYAFRNAENAKKTTEQVDETERNHLAALAQLSQVQVYKILAKNSRGGLAP